MASLRVQTAHFRTVACAESLPPCCFLVFHLEVHVPSSSPTARSLVAAQSAPGTEDIVSVPPKRREAALNRLIEAECNLDICDADHLTACMHATLNVRSLSRGLTWRRAP